MDYLRPGFKWVVKKVCFLVLKDSHVYTVIGCLVYSVIPTVVYGLGQWVKWCNCGN